MPGGRAAGTNGEAAWHDDRSPMIRVLYVAGSGRSGSTLLEMILGQVPGVTAVGELKYVWTRGVVANRRCGCGEPFLECSFWSRVGDDAFGGWSNVDAEKMSHIRARAERFSAVLAALAAKRVAGRATPYDDYAATYSRLYGAIERVSGSSVIVDSSKDLGHAFLLRARDEVDLRYLHLVRDSRGVAFSWQKSVPRPDVVEKKLYMPSKGALTATGGWITRNAVCHLLGRRTLFMRYETLMSSPRSEVERLLRHAGLQADANRLAFIGDRHVELQPTHGIAGNAGRFSVGRVPLREDTAWRSRLKARDRRMVSLLTWPFLVMYGYERPLPRGRA